MPFEWRPLAAGLMVGALLGATGLWRQPDLATPSRIATVRLATEGQRPCSLGGSSGLPAAAIAEAAAAPGLATATPHRPFSVLLGVMSNPTSSRLRDQLREWNGRFAALADGGVRVRFVFGSTFHNQSEPPIAAREMAASESRAHADLLYVDGRERLPNVGVVTEKSAAWWREIAIKEPEHDFYCKSDDDTLVHLDRLRSTLRHVSDQEGASRPVYLGHMKWRGWDVGYRFQACGGSWGGATKTVEDLLYGRRKDGKEGPGGERYPPCPNAAGPYPYMSGGMVCMSRPLALLMSRDEHFGRFLTVAKARNDYGVACKRPALCASQPPSTHMWHHEDAGIGYNVFHAIVSNNASASLIPVPGHFNDPGIIERSPSAQDMYWSSRSLFVHGIKQASHFNLALQRWTLDRPSDHLTLRCVNCSAHGADGFGWDWARLPCPRAPWGANPQPGRFCSVTPSTHYHCCGWPWLIPRLRAALRTATEAAGKPLRVKELQKRAREVLSAEADAEEAKVEVPGGDTLHAVLKDMHARGDLSYSAAGTAVVGGRELWMSEVSTKRK